MARCRPVKDNLRAAASELVEMARRVDFGSPSSTIIDPRIQPIALWRKFRVLETRGRRIPIGRRGKYKRGQRPAKPSNSWLASAFCHQQSKTGRASVPDAAAKWMPTIARQIDRLSDKELLRMRFSDLPISLDRTVVEQRARQVFAELAERGIKVTPSIWLSEEWFNPDGTVGFAIPFYLAHPRLVRLERRLMLEVEGASEREVPTHHSARDGPRCRRSVPVLSPP